MVKDVGLGFCTITELLRRTEDGSCAHHIVIARQVGGDAGQGEQFLGAWGRLNVLDGSCHKQVPQIRHYHRGRYRRGAVTGIQRSYREFNGPTASTGCTSFNSYSYIHTPWGVINKFDPPMGMFGVGRGMPGGFMAAMRQPAQLGDISSQRDGTSGASRQRHWQAAGMFSPYQLWPWVGGAFLQNRLPSGAERQMASTSPTELVAGRDTTVGAGTGVGTPCPSSLVPKPANDAPACGSRWKWTVSSNSAAAQAKLTAFDKEQSALFHLKPAGRTNGRDTRAHQ